jgi:Kef-type K+ transport system membrane component KefB
VQFFGLESSLGGEWLPFLAHFGFLMLMFHAGLEIDFRALQKEKTKNLILYFLLFAFTLAMAYGIGRALGYGFFLALVLSTTSLGLMLPALRELQLSKTSLGQSILVSATLADFFTITTLTGLVLYKDFGIGLQLFRPLLVIILFAVLLWLIKLLAWWYPHHASRLLGQSDAQELGMRATFALLFVFVGLSQLMGLEPILGAFLGGCLLSIIFENRGLLETKMAGFSYGFLIPIFFIHVGMNFPFEALKDVSFIFFTAQLLVAAIAVKILPSFFLRFRGFSWKRCILVGTLLSARLSLIIAAAEIGVEKGLLSAHLEPSIITLALVTASLAPVFFRRLSLKWLHIQL